MERPTCHKCRYFYVTYDPAMPRGCKLFNFVSVQYPSLVVEKESGQACSGFRERPSAEASQKNKGMDLNDPKYWG
jgi:hypothetical protein